MKYVVEVIVLDKTAFYSVIFIIREFYSNLLHLFYKREYVKKIKIEYNFYERKEQYNIIYIMSYF